MVCISNNKIRLRIVDSCINLNTYRHISGENYLLHFKMCYTINKIKGKDN